MKITMEIANEIAAQLSQGATADIWFDADGPDDAGASATIEATQVAMETAASALPGLVAFVEKMARMTTPEDDFAALAPSENSYESPADLVADFSDERLCGEYATFMEMVSEARKLLA